MKNIFMKRQQMKGYFYVQSTFSITNFISNRDNRLFPLSVGWKKQTDKGLFHTHLIFVSLFLIRDTEMYWNSESLCSCIHGNGNKNKKGYFTRIYLLFRYLQSGNQECLGTARSFFPYL